MPDLDSWLEPQDWQRDGDEPCVALGPEGAFDDMHLFAPCVAHTDDGYAMWYSGSRGDVRGRVFRLGLATSAWRADSANASSVRHVANDSTDSGPPAICN